MRRRWLVFVGSLLLVVAIVRIRPAASEVQLTPVLYFPLVAKSPLPLDNLALAFISNRDGHNEIYKMRADGSQQTRLTFDAADDRDPAWSPDGTRIAFASSRDGNFDLYVMRADGTARLRLTQTLTNEVHPTWSPDGGRLAFTAFPAAGGASDIYTLQADGTGLTRLTDHTYDGLSHNAPAWSPDGTRIAFVSQRDLYVMPADGSALLRLTTLMGTVVAIGQPTWSPDSRQLAFAFNQGNFPHDQPHLYITRADGSETQPRDLGVNDLPAWSPDGSRLAFTRPGAFWVGVKAQIGVMNVDGTQPMILTTQNQGDNFEPNWAP